MVLVTVDDASTETARVKSSLRRLTGPDDRQTIERAVAALEDLDAAVSFVEAIGLAELETAIAATDDPDLGSQGQRALDSFRRFRLAADGERPADHFHHGHGTDLRGDTQPTTE
jgi:hypothetical protein